MEIDNSKYYLEKLEEIHGERFTFLDTENLHWGKIIKTECRKHNYVFNYKVGYFLKKRFGSYVKFVGCEKCDKEKRRLTKAIFLMRAEKIYNDYYKLDKVNFNLGTDNIIITCPLHGDFISTPTRFLAGRGCKKCAIIKSKKTNESFINNSNKIHNNFYKYDLTNYIMNRIKVKIICPKHGVFEQRPDAHLRGQGCNMCRTEKSRNKFTDFIEKANKIHNNRYLYDENTYSIGNKKTKIICKIHGDFYQTPEHHINREQGCPLCKISKGEDIIYRFLIKNKIEYKREYKINNYNFRYDFYLPKLNILIEYDGRQHFDPIKNFGGLEGLKITQKRDHIKNKLAKKYGYTLIRLNYKQFNTLKERLVLILTKYYKYKYKNRFFKTFEDLAKYTNNNIYNITKTGQEYLTINQLKL